MYLSLPPAFPRMRGPSTLLFLSFLFLWMCLVPSWGLAMILPLITTICYYHFYSSGRHTHRLPILIQPSLLNSHIINTTVATVIIMQIRKVV
jgi:hypothetical protein